MQSAKNKRDTHEKQLCAWFKKREHPRLRGFASAADRAQALLRNAHNDNDESAPPLDPLAFEALLSATPNTSENAQLALAWLRRRDAALLRLFREDGRAPAALTADGHAYRRAVDRVLAANPAYANERVALQQQAFLVHDVVNSGHFAHLPLEIAGALLLVRVLVAFPRSDTDSASGGSGSDGTFGRQQVQPFSVAFARAVRAGTAVSTADCAHWLVSCALRLHMDADERRCHCDPQQHMGAELRELWRSLWPWSEAWRCAWRLRARHTAGVDEADLAAADRALADACEAEQRAIVARANADAVFDARRAVLLADARVRELHRANVALRVLQCAQRLQRLVVADVFAHDESPDAHADLEAIVRHSDRLRLQPVYAACTPQTRFDVEERYGARRWRIGEHVRWLQALRPRRAFVADGQQQQQQQQQATAPIADPISVLALRVPLAALALRNSLLGASLCVLDGRAPPAADVLQRDAHVLPCSASDAGECALIGTRRSLAVARLHTLFSAEHGRVHPAIAGALTHPTHSKRLPCRPSVAEFLAGWFAPPSHSAAAAAAAECTEAQLLVCAVLYTWLFNRAQPPPPPPDGDGAVERTLVGLVPRLLERLLLLQQPAAATAAAGGRLYAALWDAADRARAARTPHGRRSGRTRPVHEFDEDASLLRSVRCVLLLGRTDYDASVPLLRDALALASPSMRAAAPLLSTLLAHVNAGRDNSASDADATAQRLFVRLPRQVLRELCLLALHPLCTRQCAQALLQTLCTGEHFTLSDAHENAAACTRPTWTACAFASGRSGEAWPFACFVRELEMRACAVEVSVYNPETWRCCRARASALRTPDVVLVAHCEHCLCTMPCPAETAPTSAFTGAAHMLRLLALDVEQHLQPVQLRHSAQPQHWHEWYEDTRYGHVATANRLPLELYGSM